MDHSRHDPVHVTKNIFHCLLSRKILDAHPWQCYFLDIVPMQEQALVNMQPQLGLKWTENTSYHFRFKDLPHKNIWLEEEDTPQSFLKCMHQRSMSEDFVLMCKSIQILSLVVEGNEYHKNVASLLQLIGTLPIQVLSCQADICLTSSLISNITLFTKLTHLEVDVCCMFEDLDIQYVPQLTHVTMISTLSTPNKKSPLLIRWLLDHALLEVLIICVDYHYNFVAFLDCHAIYDHRIVVTITNLYI